MLHCTIIVKQFLATRNKTKFRSDKNSRSCEVSGRKELEISMLADSIKRFERLAKGALSWSDENGAGGGRADRDKKKIIEPVRGENSKLTACHGNTGDGGHYHKAENFTRIMSDVEIAGSAAGYPVASPVVIKIPSQWPHINSQQGVFLRGLRLYAYTGILPLSLYRVFSFFRQGSRIGMARGSFVDRLMLI